MIRQVLQNVEELVRGPHPKSLLITKETDRADAPKARGYLVVVSAEVRSRDLHYEPGSYFNAIFVE